MKNNWIIKDQNPELSAELARELNVTPLVGQLLINRGIDTDESARRFFESGIRELPSPFLMAGMEAAVERIVKAVADTETVAVYGDYDADGVTSTSLLCGFLRSLEVDAIYFTPHRVKDGYGINERAVKELGARGATLIVSTDCGITADKEVEAAKGMGIDFVVTDHHLPGERIPDAVAVVNPKLPGCEYPEKDIAGVGVAFNLALAVRARLRENGFFDSREEPNMAHYLDLVAIGTVTDRVPLEGANRIMVKEGIKRMKARARPGIEALKKVSRINGSMNSGDIGYRIGPRINAAGRISGPETAVELLLSESSEQAQEIARRLDEQNRSRQQLERDALSEAISVIESGEGGNSACIVVASRNWHPGIIGPVASKIVDRYSKPAFAISVDEDGTGRGSGRSVENLNLFEVLKHCGGMLERCGGHAMAAGITVSEDKIDTFRDALEEYLGKTPGDAKQTQAEKTHTIDAKVGIGDLSIEMVRQMEVLEPFGSGNPNPLLLLEGANIVSHNIINGAHIKLFVEGGNGSGQIEAIWWNAVGRDGSEEPEGLSDLVFTPEINTWGNRQKLSLRMVDLNKSQSGGGSG